jgi:hypothetical protein
MRKFLILFVAAAFSLAALPAHADRAYSGGHGAPSGQGSYRAPGGYPAQGYHGHGGYHGGGYYPWAGLALFSAFAGLAILAESNRPPYADPYYGAPVYGGPTLFIEQQPNASPYPAGNWYYCNSSALYYPYTKACPEGWQAVAPSPQ